MAQAVEPLSECTPCFPYCYIINGCSVRSALTGIQRMPQRVFGNRRVHA